MFSWCDMVMKWFTTTFLHPLVIITLTIWLYIYTVPWIIKANASLFWFSVELAWKIRTSSQQISIGVAVLGSLIGYLVHFLYSASHASRFWWVSQLICEFFSGNSSFPSSVKTQPQNSNSICEFALLQSPVRVW